MPETSVTDAPTYTPTAVYIRCPKGCPYEAMAKRDGLAVKKTERHIIHAHGLQVIQGGKAQ